MPAYPTLESLCDVTVQAVAVTVIFDVACIVAQIGGRQRDS